MYWYYIIIAFILFIISLVIIKIKRKDFHLEINKLIQYLGGYDNITVVVIENYPVDLELAKKDDLIKIDSYDTFEMTNFDMVLSIAGDEELEFKYIFNNKLFNMNDVEDITNHFNNIMNDILSKPEGKLCDINMISELEENKVVKDFNSYKKDYPLDSNICKIFKEKSEI